MYLHPAGDIIDLPSGATPIDFAYHVHTEIGHRCRGAKINGKLVSLDYTLKTGDQVEILTSKQGGPSRDWLNANLGLVKTQRARSKIRNWFKKQDRNQNADHGKLMLDREIKRLGLKNVDLDQLAKNYEFKSLEEFQVAIGCGDLPIGRIINNLVANEEGTEDPLLITRPVVDKPISGRFRHRTGFERLADCPGSLLQAGSWRRYCRLYYPWKGSNHPSR